MSTRCTTHFCWKETHAREAIVYRHSDGYPEGHGTDLYRFLQEVRDNVEDNRFDDPSYLAAKLVVWLANEFNHSWERAGDGGFEKTRNQHPLDFLSVGICMEDPGDIAYRYIICCGTRDEEGLPLVECHSVIYNSDRTERCEIPRPDKEPDHE